MKKPVNWIPYILTFCVVTLLLIGADWLFVNSVQLQYETRLFVATTGVITSSFESDPSGEYNFARIHYTFVVDGHTYGSDRHRYFEMGETPGEIVAHYPVEAKVTVYYDPENPNDAILMPGLDAVTISFIKLMAFINLAWVIICVVVWLKVSGRLRNVSLRLLKSNKGQIDKSERLL